MAWLGLKVSTMNVSVLPYMSCVTCVSGVATGQQLYTRTELQG